MIKPDVASPRPPGRGGRNVGIETNMTEAVSGTLYYELMAAWYSIGDEDAMRKYNDKIFKSVNKNFGRHLDGRAAAMPKKYHHVYEWGGVGNSKSRLWKLQKRNTGNDRMIIRYDFLTSKKVAPIHPSLQKPGPSGKFVKKSTVFKNKAFVMENGIPVTIRPKTAKWLAIPSTFDFNSTATINFTRGPVRIQNPGGTGVRFSFAQTFNGYFSSGLAVKHLNSDGTLQTPARLTRKAGEDVPSAIYRISSRRGVDKQMIEEMALRNVRKYMMGEYDG
jgi:hypothetical protein